MKYLEYPCFSGSPGQKKQIQDLVIRTTSLFKTQKLRRVSGFTLVELLAVMSIMVTMAGLAAVALPGLKDAREMSSAADDVAGVLERARTLAMAKSTYVWVGFFEEPEMGPAGTAGVGKLAISVVSSTDGTRLYEEAVNSPVSLPAARLEQAAKLLTISRIHFDVLAPEEVLRQEIPAACYQMGSAEFGKLNGSANLVSFNYPLLGTPKYTFTKIIEFSPLGDASKIVDTPTRWIEIGLRKTRGVSVDVASKNVAAVRIAGIGGQIRVLRP